MNVSVIVVVCSKRYYITKLVKYSYKTKKYNFFLQNAAFVVLAIAVITI